MMYFSFLVVMLVEEVVVEMEVKGLWSVPVWALV